MKENTDKLSYNGKDYTIAFTINVLDAIQERYKTLDAWIDEAYGKTTGEPSAKALKFVIFAMVNEGIEIDNFKNGTKEPPITEAQAGWILTELIRGEGISKLVERIDALMGASLNNDGENSKNA